MPISARVGFLGAGKMATALAQGWIRAQLLLPEQILASDPIQEARQYFSQQTQAKTVTSNAEVVHQSDVVVLAIKPQVMSNVLETLRSSLTDQHLVISIAAGISLRQLQQELGENARLIRVMPNTPCLVGASASGYSPAETATADDVALVDQLLNAVGCAFRLPESLLDAVTGLSGSGPAYVAIIIEALADGGVKAGLPRDVAQTLAAQTVFGTTKMILETDLHPGQLKDAVSSPGGTTIAGLSTLEDRGVRGALIQAVEAATQRAKALGEPGA